MKVIFNPTLPKAVIFEDQVECEKSKYRTLPIKSKHIPYEWYNKPLKIEVQKPCVYLHGSGVFPVDNIPINKFETGYWGNIRSYTSQCSSHTFAYSDTVYRSWNDTTLQKEICKVATQGASDSVIRNKIIFGHSMGTLILTAAILNNYCHIDEESTSWYGVCAPFEGTRIPIFLIDICRNILIPDIVKSSICHEGQPIPAYKALYPNTPGLDIISKHAVTYLDGVMCGESGYGITSPYSAGLVTLALIASLETPNDGLVAYFSCHTNNSNTFSSASPEENFYKAQINHADGTCRNNDGWFGGDRKPCLWYALRN